MPQWMPANTKQSHPLLIRGLYIVGWDVDLNTGLFDSRTENVVQQTRTRVEKRQTLTDCLASLSNDDDGDDGFDDCFDDGK